MPFKLNIKKKIKNYKIINIISQAIKKYIKILNSHKRVKLGVTYSLFSGEELLRGSILSIRNNVDYINVVFQKYSWFGDESSHKVMSTLYSLIDEGLVDNIIEYEFTDFSNKDLLAYYTLDKKNKGLDDLKKNKCTHCMIMDVDEYYVEAEFLAAKEFVLKNKITHSCCSIYDYRFTPSCRNRDISKYAVPFIFKLRRTSYLTQNHKMPCKVDNLRSLKYRKLFDHFYFFNSICMHHMTGIRYNFEKKLDATITNATYDGEEYVNGIRKEYLRQKELPFDELLKEKNNLGGYVLVDDVFNISNFEK